MTTAYENLKAHIARYAYTKGAYKGSAPADKNRRARTHHRVTDRGDDVVITFHAAHIIRAYPDGSIMLDTNGWHDSPATREAMGGSLYLCGDQYRGWLSSVRLGGYSQTALRLHNGSPTYRYYDGMKLDAAGRLLTEIKPFSKRVADREEREEFRKDAAEFRAVLPVLHATTPYGEWRYVDRLTRAIHNPEKWPDIVALYRKETPQETWRAIYSAATEHMTTLIDVPHGDHNA